MQENYFQLCSVKFFQIAHLYDIDGIFTVTHV